MIYAKTVCKNPGSYVEIVPVGLNVRLQYNQNGLLQSMQTQSKEGEWIEDDMPSDMYAKLCNHVPSKISITQGTTWVEGVFYFSEISKCAGELPFCADDDYRARIMKGDTTCAFYAGYAESLAVKLQGALAIRNWLSFNKFQLLPGTVVPLELSEDTIQMLMATGAYQFKYPYISGYYIFSGEDCEYVDGGLVQYEVVSVEQELDQNGYVYGKVTTTTHPLKLNYSEIVSKNIQEGSILLCYSGEYVEILDSRSTSFKKISNMYTCPVCHKNRVVPVKGPMQCDDPHCMSKSYPDAARMLKVLNLPSISYEDYVQDVKDHKILTATDVLLLDGIKEVKITASLPQILRAGTPYDVCPDSSFFDKFVKACGNNVDTLVYYLKNPKHIFTELECGSAASRNFVIWCNDGYNLSTLLTLLTSIEVADGTVQLDVSPIFRGTKIAMTGKFKRGDYAKISSILESYSATIVDDLTHDLPSVLITGSTNESISGKMVKMAREFNVPVVEEDAFFTQYEIDEDLRSQNLL